MHDPAKPRVRYVAPVLAMIFALALRSSPAGGAVSQWAPSDSTAENDAIRYSKTLPTDAIARLQRRIDQRSVDLRFDGSSGYLGSLLRALDISPSSQLLVFSKTSFQRQLISPSHPRALYFGDGVYVGWVPGAPFLEVASIDPQLGAIFYTLRQDETSSPRFGRETRRCLQCHDSPSVTAGVPGLIMKSVATEKSGEPILAAGTFVTTDQSPLQERWGGWFVTGARSPRHHRGAAPGGYVGTSSYLTPHSDIVALMVFGHQKHVQNLITRLNHRARMALGFDRLRNHHVTRSAGDISPATHAIIGREAEPLVQAMLLVKEPLLAEPLAGASGFTEEFARDGPRDRAGRSLRDLDLTTRLFRHPCSYLIYSESFDALPRPAKDQVYRRLWAVLTGKDRSEAFRHLSPDDRAAIMQILLETKSEFAALRDVRVQSTTVSGVQ